MMSPLRSTFEGYRLPHISNVLVQLIMLLHQHCRKYHSKCVYHIAGVEKIYWWLFLNIKKMTARIWSAVYLETEEILKTIVRLLTKTLTMVRWANAGVTICWLGYDGFQLHEMKPLVPLLRNLITKYFFLRGRPRRMFWFSLRFQEFSWWKKVSILTTQCDMRIQNQQITKTYTIFILGWTNENGKIYWRESRIGHGQGRRRGGCLGTTWNEVQVPLKGAQLIWGKATHGMPCKIGRNALWYMRVWVCISAWNLWLYNWAGSRC